MMRFPPISPYKTPPPLGGGGGRADGEGIIVEYRKHIPSRRGDSRIARRMFADAVRTGGETPPLRICGENVTFSRLS